MNIKYRLLACIAVESVSKQRMPEVKQRIEIKCEELLGKYNASVTFIDHSVVKVRTSTRRYVIESCHLLVLANALNVKKCELDRAAGELLEFINKETDRVDIEFNVII